MEPGMQAPGQKKHLFKVDIMVEEASSALALAALLQILNNPKVNDFRITEGLEFGGLIEKLVSESRGQPIPLPPHQSAPANRAFAGGQAREQDDPKPKDAGPGRSPARSGAGAEPRADDPDSGPVSLDKLLLLKESGALVRIVVVKGKGVKLSIPCRILNFDADGQQLTIYHVDEKKVYTFTLNEIEDIIR